MIVAPGCTNKRATSAFAGMAIASHASNDKTNADSQ
jgi:hypothetical protein